MTDFRSAAFRTEPFNLFVGAGSVKQEFPFPVLTAREWLEVLGSGNWVVAVVGTIPGTWHETFIDRVELGKISPDDVRAFAHSALSYSAGRPWWEAERLVNSCFTDGGRLLGTVLTNGVDPSRMTLAVFLACVWATLTRGADAEAMAKLESELLPPPPEATEAERAELEDDMSGMVERFRGMPGVRIG